MPTTLARYSRSSASLTFTVLGVVDDVRVGDDVSLLVDEEAGPERLLAHHLVAASFAAAAAPAHAVRPAEEGEHVFEAGEVDAVLDLAPAARS